MKLTTTNNVLPKKRGRVKGSKAELDALTSGGTVGRAKKAIFGGNKSNKETPWKLDETKYHGRLMNDKSSLSSYSTEESSDSEDSFSTLLSEIMRWNSVFPIWMGTGFYPLKK